ncbi:MAG: peptidylprolyl isomerase [Boseongicola sp. SB0664_bin_43]|uniref:Parvulin-like PPIase n=1 Tax=Boseongicola sp. SB0664_bin_43 TaxID=2604844 RepID=A0A6B0Y1L8_9RHOB|nr:peptidylprolyl isomerase [Boseongicola sp. SB0664_bin_43]
MAILEESGIERESFRAFIEAGVAWRQLVRNQFGPSVRASILDHQIRRTLATTGTEGGMRVLVSEIVLPARDPNTAVASRERAVRIAALQDEDEFAAAARRYSIAASADRGGEVGWESLDALPDGISDTVAGLEVGEVSNPIEYEGNIAILLLRDIERVQEGTKEALLIDYALLRLEGGVAEAAEVAKEVDDCGDLYRFARNLPEDRLIRDVVPSPELPADVRAAVAVLDVNESSTELTRNGNAVLLMLCERRPALKSNIDFDIVGGQILNLRLSNTAAHYLAELRASTNVIDLTN